MYATKIKREDIFKVTKRLKLVWIGLIFGGFVLYGCIHWSKIVALVQPHLSCSSTKGVRVQFSYTKYPEYRQKIAQLLSKEHEIACVKATDVAIDLHDLNDDGCPEVIVLVTANGFVGASGGMHTDIYLQENGQLKPVWPHHLTGGNLVISQHKTKGYHDMIDFEIGISLKKENDYKHIFVWGGPEGYTYLKAESLTDQEREMYPNEFL